MKRIIKDNRNYNGSHRGNSKVNGKGNGNTRGGNIDISGINYNLSSRVVARSSEKSRLLYISRNFKLNSATTSSNINRDNQFPKSKSFMNYVNILRNKRRELKRQQLDASKLRYISRNFNSATENNLHSSSSTTKTTDVTFDDYVPMDYELVNNRNFNSATTSSSNINRDNQSPKSKSFMNYVDILRSKRRELKRQQLD